MFCPSIFRLEFTPLNLWPTWNLHENVSNELRVQTDFYVKWFVICSTMFLI